ncbi:alpha/beta fold hydrolase [Deinococcus sp.]|uniref:alpha/beta hydrolase family protein n=1 Tax=Deinococcus sp. TaxID=47478 RepID=UPI0025C19217|nr:alpha/beta fold hydrolase [Deinococcus sp.]
METFAQFSVEHQRLYGMLHTPDGNAPEQGWPSVLMLHGFTGNRTGDHRSFVLLSRRLARQGIASLRFDCRGSGESQGDFAEMTVSREVEDAVAAADYLRRQPGIDPERVMLLGYGMGAVVACLSLAQLRPHRLALWASALPELWLRYLRGGFVPPVITDDGGWPLGRAFLQEVVKLRPLEAAAAWGGVAQVFHGDADTTCPPAWGVQYGRALNCDVMAIPGAGHSFDSLEHVETLHRETARFFSGG